MAYLKFNSSMALLYSVLVGIFVVFSITFIAAYLSPEKAVIVDINSVGEANLELLMVIMIWILLVYSIHYIYTHVNGGRAIEESF